MPAPANDNFASRQSIAPVSVSVDIPFDLNGSTLESGEQNTSGMAGSVWYQVTVPTDKWVYFEVPTGVEVRSYRGTATLSGMLFRSVSNNSSRQGFNLGSAFTYFVKLQSATAAESGTMHVRPYAWTDWITSPVLQQPPNTSHISRMDRARADTVAAIPPTGFSTESAAWSFLQAGPDETGDRATGSGPCYWSLAKGATGSSDWTGHYEQHITVWDYAESGGPLSSTGRPTDPFTFDPTLVANLTYATDPVSGNQIQYETTAVGTIAAGNGRLSFTATNSGSSGSFSTDGNTNGARDADFYLNAATAPTTATTAPSWPTPAGSGILSMHLAHTVPGGVLTSTVSGGTLGQPNSEISYDTVSLLTGTRLELYISPDPAMPTMGALATDGSVSAQMKITPNYSAKIPVQYPRYRTYSPLPAVSTGWQVGSVAW